MSRPALLLLVLLLAGSAGAFLISNAASGGRFVYESVPANRRPIHFLVDTEALPGVADPVSVAQDLMNQWNAVPEAQDVFGQAQAGSSFNGATVGQSFGIFTDNSREIAFDDTGEILNFFGVSQSVLGITLKSVDSGTGQLLDFLVVLNTQPGILVAPGSGATTEELVRATLVHELGHATGLGHTPVGIANLTTFGLDLATPARMPTMYPYRLPTTPQEGATIERDDEAALTRSYPGDVTGLGSIRGQVRSVSGAFIDEIAVRAVGDAGAGPFYVGTITNTDGSGRGTYEIPNLPPGGYRVVLETVNGRGRVDAGSLAPGGEGLGAHPFVYAPDERWQPGDTYDPSVDDPADFALVQVRASRATGGVDFVLNGAPLLAGTPENGSLVLGDSQLVDLGGGQHFADYFVFQGTAGANITLLGQSPGFTPHLSLLRPSDLAPEEENTPIAGGTAQITRALSQTGIYTVVLSARATTGNPGGSGNYSLTLTGAGGALPPPPVITGASLAAGPAQPGAQQLSSPVCIRAMAQLRLTAPSNEELWVDRVRLRASGTGDERTDVALVRLVRDSNGNGLADRGEPEIASGTFSSDNGILDLDGLDLQLAPGTVTDLVVTYDVTVQSVSSTAALPLLALLPLGLLGFRRSRRAAALLLLVALLPLACGGGGSGCNGPFDPAGAVVTFQVRLDPGDILAFTSAGDPLVPLAAPAAAVVSGTLSVSN